MTPAEIQEACKALAAKVGPKARVWLTLSDCYGFSASLDTKGYISDRDKEHDAMAFTVRVERDECAAFEGVFPILEARWLAEVAQRTDRHTEEIALEIIRLTAEFGECTDAGLRAKFGPIPADVASVAVDRANSMAANGPFSIVAMRGANGPPSFGAAVMAAP